MKHLHGLRGAVLALALLAAGPASACLVCVPLPERTLADRVMEDALMVLARPDPDDPFRYVAEVYLKGAPPAAGAERPIPFLVDSPTRRRMAADEGLFALLSRETPTSDWTPLGVASPEMVSVVREMIDRAERWRVSDGGEERFAFFAELHSSPAPAIRALALAEISASPYAQIRSITPGLSRAEVVKVLRDPAMLEWAPIHILLLGLSDDPTDRQFVRSAFEAAGRSPSVSTLGAWATAYLEGEGAAALDRIEADFIRDPRRPREQLTAIVRALSTFAAVSDPEMRNRIAAQFGTLANTRPDLAGQAARELTLVEDWSLADVFEDLLDGGAIASPAEEFAIAYYVHRARAEGEISKAGRGL